MMTDFEVIEAAYKARLLFDTDAEYRQAMGMTWETLRDNRTDEAMVRRVMSVLDDECRGQCGLGLADLAERYVEASEAYGGMDWRGRKQLSSRRRFMRMVFRRQAMPGVKLTAAELLEFQHREGDEALMEQVRQVDAIWLLLFCFDVVGPMPQRGRDGEVDVGKMSALLRVLREDAPTIGLVEKPAVFDIVAAELERRQNLSRARMWAMLDQVANACFTVSTPEVGAQVQAEALSMPGIWIDNRDEGRSRFWIFPENTRFAFCYQHDGLKWVQSTYELGLGPDDLFMILRGEGFDRAMLSGGGKISPDEFVFVRFAVDENSVEFDAEQAPQWMDWRRFERIEPTDTRHEDFMQIVDDLYNPRSPQSMLLTVKAPLMTNAQDAKVGQDADYVYVSDFREADRFELQRADDDTFLYTPIYKYGKPKGNFMEIEVSQERPLYALPITRRRLGVATGRERQFYECTASVRPGHTIIKYRCPRDGELMLFFTSVGMTFTMTEALEFGAKRIEGLNFE